MGLGGLGGSAQMLFGGSGGQDLFQQVTWVMIALFMAGSLMLTIMSSSKKSAMPSYKTQSAPVQPTEPIE